MEQRFSGAGKQRLVGDTHRDADRQEVNEMRAENEQFKTVVVELMLKNPILKGFDLVERPASG